MGPPGPIARRDVMDVAGCSLAELIDDPLIGLVMKSDGVDRCELELLLEQAARTAAVIPTRRTAVSQHDYKPAGAPDQS
jgi:hypothetical protein